MSASSSFAADYLTKPPLLRGEERWEIEKGRRCDPAEQFVRARLQSHPAVPVQIRRGNDVPKKAAPFHPSTFNIAVTGVMLSLPYILTGRLAASIGLHAAWNFFQGVVYGFPVSGLATPARLLVIEQAGPPLWTGADFGPEAGLVGLFVCVLGTALIVWRERRRRGSLTLCADLVDGAGMAAGGGSLPAVDANERPLDDISPQEDGFGQIQ